MLFSAPKAGAIFEAHRTRCRVPKARFFDALQQKEAGNLRQKSPSWSASFNAHSEPFHFMFLGF
jgi:hypothetical protein